MFVWVEFMEYNDTIYDIVDKIYQHVFFSYDAFYYKLAHFKYQCMHQIIQTQASECMGTYNSLINHF